MESLISVIIPVYQAEKTISRCLDFLLIQTYNNWEALCIDDGSTDTSSSILDQYSLKDHRIHVVHQNNSGVSNARNKALDLAQGEFITFIDSDDWIEPDTLELLLKAVQTSESDMAICGIVMHNKLTKNTHRHTPLGLPISSITKTTLIDCRIMRRLPPGNCSKLFRKSIIDQHHLRYNEAMAQGEDYLFLLNYISHTETLTSIDLPLYHYVVNNNSSATKKFIHGTVEFSQYQKGLAVALQCSSILPSQIKRKEWMGGLFAIQCDYWIWGRSTFATFPEIKRLNNRIFIMSIRQLFPGSRQPYAFILLCKTLVKAFLFYLKSKV